MTDKFLWTVTVQNLVTGQLADHEMYTDEDRAAAAHLKAMETFGLAPYHRIADVRRGSDTPPARPECATCRYEEVRATTVACKAACKATHVPCPRWSAIPLADLLARMADQDS